MPSDPFAALGEYLTATEAIGLATLLGAGEHTAHALRSINAGRRARVATLLSGSGLGHLEPALSVAVLRAVAGAKAVHGQLVPVWTMPGNEASVGHLTGEFHRLVKGARLSVTCATYNFSKNSNMWDALRLASEQPGVTVCVYVDSERGESGKVKAQLPLAIVYKSAQLHDGQSIVSHAKFVVVDHKIVLLTSANFSRNAETQNIEFGLLIQDNALATSIESTMSSKHGSLYILAEDQGIEPA